MRYLLVELGEEWFPTVRLYEYVKGARGREWKHVGGRVVPLANRVKLVEAIRETMSVCGGLSPAQHEALAALHTPSTHVVITSHQPHFLMGPAYVVLKALYAVRVADVLSEELGVNCVPVFWVHSDDHDWQELSGVWIGGEWLQPEGRQFEPFGLLSVEFFGRQVGRARKLLSGYPFGEEAVAVLDFYSGARRMEEAFVLALNYLLGEEGLLFVSSFAGALRGSIVPLVEKELTRRISDAVLGGALLRPQYPEVFYIGEGSRRRVTVSPQGEVQVKGADRRWASVEEFLKWGEEHPGRVSVSVVLRPLWQESVVGSSVFIGGLKECAYWLELERLFRNAGVDMPALFVRPVCFFLPESFEQVIEQAGLAPADLLVDTPQFMKDFIERRLEQATGIKDFLEEVGQVHRRFVDMVAKGRPFFLSYVAANLRQVEKSLEKMKQKLRKMEREHYTVQIKPVERLSALCWFRGKYQERWLAGVELLARLGRQKFGTLGRQLPCEPGCAVLMGLLSD